MSKRKRDRGAGDEGPGRFLPEEEPQEPLAPAETVPLTGEEPERETNPFRAGEETPPAEESQPKKEKKARPAKKEQSQAWLAFRAKAGSALRAFGKKLGEVLRLLGRKFLKWLRANFAMPPREALRTVAAGLTVENPTLILMMGLCAALGTTATLQGALGMGLTMTAVLICSALTVAFLRRLVPKKLRGLCCLMAATLFVTLADLALRSYLPELSERLGLFVPLLAVNWIVLKRLDSFAACHIPGCAALDALGSGLGFTLALCIVGTLREALGAGTLWGIPLFGGRLEPVLGAGAPYGGFLILGAVLACVQWVRQLKERRGKK